MENAEKTDRPLCPNCEQLLAKNGITKGVQKWKCKCGYKSAKISQDKPGMPKKHCSAKDRYKAAYERKSLKI